MAGAFEPINGNDRYLEANVRNGIESMQRLAEKFPDDVPVIWSGFEIGIAVPYPRQSVAREFGYVDHHIVREAYLMHSGPDHDRPCWDLTSVLHAVRPDDDYFRLSQSGRVKVDDDGYLYFTPAADSLLKKESDPPETRLTDGKEQRSERVGPLFQQTAEGRDRYLQMTHDQALRVRESLRYLVTQPPCLPRAGQPAIE
jgi:hypothetical protein